MYIITSAIDGVPLVGNRFLYEARSIETTQAIAFIDGDNSDVDGIVLSEKEYLAYWRSGIITSDKTTIMSDGNDTATVTAEVHPDLTEVTFYHADTGESITTVPVDPTTYTTTLKVTATTPGVIRIRAGEPTVTRLNEVVITAQ